MKEKRKFKSRFPYIDVYKVYDANKKLFSDGGVDNWEQDGKQYIRIEDVKRHLKLLEKSEYNMANVVILRFTYKAKNVDIIDI